MRLNGFVGSQHQWFAQDVWTFLEGLSMEEPFELSVVDPPTFSNSKKLDHDWNVQRDAVPLLRKVLQRTVPGGVIYFSTNLRQFKLDSLALADATLREISRQTVPEDFRNRRIHRCWRIVKRVGDDE